MLSSFSQEVLAAIAARMVNIRTNAKNKLIVVNHDDT